MPLRTLLGYEPSQARRYDDYGGQFFSFTPATPARSAVTATRKSKYQAPMGRIKKLPPIDEESTPVNTPRPRLNHEGTQARIKRLPKKTFAPREGTLDLEPVKPKPVQSVKPVPREEIFTPADDLKLDFEKPKKKETKYVVKQRQQPGGGIYTQSSPRDVNHAIVDGIVADYLHYARYSNIIPIYEGTSSTACPCCTDRNQQNVRTLLGLPANHTPKQHPPVAQKYDEQSKLTEPKEYEDLDEDAKMFPNSLYTLEKMKRSKRTPKQTPSEKKKQEEKNSWMNYQPLPSATNYLNPEFSRPSLTHDLLVVEAQRNNERTANKVVEAGSNFDTAMNKLETLTFGSGSYGGGYQ